MSDQENLNETENRDEWIRINGYEQVLELLRAADRDFRESLLSRIGQRNRNLALKLRQELTSGRA